MSILQALDGYYDRMAKRNEVVTPGYSTEPIGFVIALNSDGDIAGVQSWLQADGKKGRSEKVPKWFGRSGRGSTPYFLWDNTTYALGVVDATKSDKSSDKEKPSRDHEAFIKLHHDALGAETDTGLVALRKFLERWTPDQFVPPKFEKWMLKHNVAFRLDGEFKFLHERDAAKRLTQKLRDEEKSAGSKSAFCLIRGTHLPIVKLHPKIKGVDGTAAAEVPLVSFNSDAFTSYNKKQGDNAPTSEDAAFRYGAALNSLLDRTSRNPLKIGDATVAFWADTSDAVSEDEAAASEDFMMRCFGVSREAADEDEQEAAKLNDALQLLAKGRPVEDLNLGLKSKTRFHVLGLSPNAARLSVRFWLTDNFSAFARRLAEHANDLKLDPEPSGWGAKPPSIQKLLTRILVPDPVRAKGIKETYKYLDKNAPLVAGELTRSVLTGAQYPRNLLNSAIIRLRAGDDPKSGWHAAVIKAVINRSEEDKVPDHLEPRCKSPAYQLGRLFALLEAAQYAALGRVNAPIGDRYYGAASATPARVFGPLLRGLRHHLSDARKRGQGGWIESRIAEVMTKLPEDLPRTLRLEDQGRFAVGYYHEAALRFSKQGKNNEADEVPNE